MADVKIVQLLNQLVKELPGFVPFDVPLDKNEGEQKAGLAQAFAIKGFRDYIQKTIRQQVVGTLDIENMEALWVHKGRVLALKELYRAAETCFKEYEKLSTALKGK